MSPQDAFHRNPTARGTAMNCDEAFDALTNPAERDNSALQWHLEFCPRCREMQEVLAPALALFAVECDASEAFAEPNPQHRPERFSDPGSSPLRLPAPFLTPEAIHIAEETARDLRPRRRVFNSAWFRCIAAGAVCLMLSLGFLMVSAASKPASPAHSDPVMLADRCLWTDRDANQKAAPPEDPSSRWVVLSCVSCHLEQSME